MCAVRLPKPLPRVGDEQNHGVPTHGLPASREDDYLRLVLVMQAGW